MARTVEGRGPPGVVRFAIALGLEAHLAADLAQARGLSLRREDAQPTGPGCARCHIAGCPQRSLPPRGATLRFATLARGITPFEFGESPNG